MTPLRPPRKRKTSQLNLRFEPRLKIAAEAAAADNGRTLTSLIEKLLLEFLQPQGYLATKYIAPRPRAGRKDRRQTERDLLMG
jgi:hypothetical protein